MPASSRLEFFEKFSANNFALSDAEDKTSGLLNRGGIADLPLLRALLAIPQKSREQSFWEIMDSFVLLAYASLAASRILLQWLLSSLKFTLESEGYLFGTKKVIYMNYGSSTRSWKPWRWMRVDMVFSMRDIYVSSNRNPFTKFTSSSRSTELKDILLWNISQMTIKTIPITRIVISYTLKWGIPLWIWW